MLPGDQHQQQRVHEAVCRERDRAGLTIFFDFKNQPTNQQTLEHFNYCRGRAKRGTLIREAHLCLVPSFWPHLPVQPSPDHSRLSACPL